MWLYLFDAKSLHILLCISLIQACRELTIAQGLSFNVRHIFHIDFPMITLHISLHHFKVTQKGLFSRVRHTGKDRLCQQKESTK